MGEHRRGVELSMGAGAGQGPAKEPKLATG